jgi:hypothetical protein
MFISPRKVGVFLSRVEGSSFALAIPGLYEICLKGFGLFWCFLEFSWFFWGDVIFR